jgi:uncharacterized membrane protein
MNMRLRAAAAYVLMPLSSLIVLLVFRDDRRLRFHAIQGIIVGVVVIVANRLLNFIASTTYTPVTYGPNGIVSGGGSGATTLIIGLIQTAVALATFALWGALIVFAFNNETWKVPVIGDFAARQSGLEKAAA